ncbi:MAG: M48 family metallopeptidase [candidate division WOR-3 bacterium]|nr:MAG: M48 family metallopeptidase [candidate division WOR-3 bacterium]
MPSQRTHPLIDAERQKIARRYRNNNLRLSIGSLIVSAVLLAVILLLDLSKGFVGLLSGTIGTRPLLIAVYFSALYFVFSFLTLPFGYAEGYVIEHKYGFSTQNRRAWFMDWLKSFLVTYVIGLLVFEVIYLLIPLAPTLWWLWLSAIMIGFSVILTNVFPVVILPLFYRSSPIQNDEVNKEITQLSSRAGVDVQGVYSIDLSSKTTKANAAVVGLGNTKRILIGDTLLSKYELNEVLSAVAHEIVHYSEHHMWWLILWQSLTTLLMFYIFYRIQPVVYAWFGFVSAADVAAFPVFAIIFFAISYVFRPVGAGLSRYYERRADSGALELTGDTLAFVHLIAKFCNEQLSIAFPNRFIEWYKYSHPSPGKRIEFAERWRKK